MRKRILIALIIVVVLAAFALFIINAFNEKPVIKNPDNALVTSVYYRDEVITSEIDTVSLIEYLATLTCTKTLKSYSPYYQSDVDFEINLRDGSKPLHILVGNINICYESSDKGFFEIENPDAVKKTLINMFTEQGIQISLKDQYTISTIPFSIEEAERILEEIEYPILLVSRSAQFDEVEEEFAELSRIYGEDGANTIIGSFYDLYSFKRVYSIVYPLIYHEGVEVSSAQIEQHIYDGKPDLDYELLRIVETLHTSDFDFQRETLFKKDESGNWRFFGFEGSTGIHNPNMYDQDMQPNLKEKYKD